MILVDTNVFLDIATRDPEWYDWSSSALAHAADRNVACINPIIYAEVSLAFDSIERLDTALPPDLYQRRPLPYAAGFLTGRAFADYRRRGGTKTTPLPDFYIGAHAAVEGLDLLTRDSRGYRTYFPTVRLIAP
ncbi:MAG: type II toxin-antitoxin system VapC family toxin [Acidimicrobiia bacterium]